MARPVRHLPVIQNWDCHACGQCCYEYEVVVTDEEKRRVEGQNWHATPELKGVNLFARVGSWWRPRYRLNSRPDGGCVFLNETGLCRIHAKFGSAAKPLACQVYPYALVPAGDHWRVGVRFACPSAADNKGRPVLQQSGDVRQYGRQLEEREGIAGRDVPTPALDGRRAVNWDDFQRFGGGLLALLADESAPVELRMRRCLALGELCRAAKFDKVSGQRLSEFLELVGDHVRAEVPRAAEVPAPGWVGRMLFRQSAAIYARRDVGPRRGLAARGRIALFRAALRFARGVGPVPRMHALMPAVTFEQMEDSPGPLTPAAEEILGRYYRVKAESLQFAGPTNFGLGFWDGWESLALTYPAILWLSRAFRDLPRDRAVSRAVQIVDDNFGYNRLLGTRRHARSVSVLARRGELAKLIAWYGR